MNTVSKFIAGTALAAVALCAPSSDVRAATTYSSILGYYTIDIPAGASAWTAGLVTKKEHQGSAAGYATSSQNASNTTITVSDRDLGGLSLNNHYIEILDEGTWEGLVLDIEEDTVTSTGANSSTFDVVGSLSGFPGLSSTPEFCIRQHVTLSTLFFNGGGFIDGDLVVLFDEVGGNALFRWDDDDSNGARWETTGNTAADDVIIYPGQAFLALTPGAGGVRSVIVGRGGVSYVKETPTIIPILKDAFNLVGALNPLGGDLVSLNSLDLGLTTLQSNEFIVELTTDGLFTADGIYRRSGSVLVTTGNSSTASETFPASSATLILPTQDVVYWKSPAVDPGDVILNP